MGSHRSAFQQHCRRAGAAVLALAGMGAAAQDAASVYSARESDWRNGAVYYQVFVDRFAPSAHLEDKRALYAPPRILHEWKDEARHGPFLKEAGVARHEIEFWGGDLQSLESRLDYVQQLGADALYLNPIVLAFTNHKYDAFDYQQISPEYGDRAQFRHLAESAHARGIRIVLDGVFNHMGRNAPIFREAMADPHSPWRDWFVIGPEYPGGARTWYGTYNLPELNLENPTVREAIYGAPDSVVRSYLRDGADGWRLDVAFDIGPRFLGELTAAAHAQKPDSVVVGEIVNYPRDWFPALDGIMNYPLRYVVYGMARGEIAPPTALRMTARIIGESGIEPMLRSWLSFDNHDNPRIATEFPQQRMRRLVQALQFTLPGSPNVWYGSELGQKGGADPENRGPMRWELVKPDNPELRWMHQIIDMHHRNRALRVGDFRTIESRELFAFERYTDRALDSVFVLANPQDHAVTESVMVANSGLMDLTPVVNLLAPAGSKPVAEAHSGFLRVTVPAMSVLVLKQQLPDMGGYNRNKRFP